MNTSIFLLFTCLCLFWAPSAGRRNKYRDKYGVALILPRGNYQPTGEVRFSVCSKWVGCQHAGYYSFFGPGREYKLNYFVNSTNYEALMYKDVTDLNVYDWNSAFVLVTKGQAYIAINPVIIKYRCKTVLQKVILAPGPSKEMYGDLLEKIRIPSMSSCVN